MANRWQRVAPLEVEVRLKRAFRLRPAAVRGGHVVGHVRVALGVASTLLFHLFSRLHVGKISGI